MKKKILSFIQNKGDFEETALQLWKWQIENNVEYGRFCNGKRPRRWQDIPAVPVGLFRDLNLTCFPPFLATHIFKTSGTTGPRGIHRLMDTEVYDIGAKIALNQFIGELPQQGLSLVSPSFDSSLGHMCRSFVPKLLQCFLPDIGVLVEEAWQYLRKIKDPIFFPATGFAMAALLENANSPCRLPKGSVIMITGGFKGKHTQLDEELMQKKLFQIFPATRIVSEYGMTELSSQLWATKLGEPFHPPHWLRAVAVDPNTGKAINGAGQLKFIDLANHQTVLAIETKDVGEVLNDGAVVLYGRLPKAEPRGCSLSVEEVDKAFVRQKRKEAAPHVPRAIPRGDTNKSDAVHLSLIKLRNLSPKDFSEGLSPKSANQGWLNSIDAITIEGLNQALSISDLRPPKISIVAAQGVFSAPLEWISLCLASGASVHVKAPTNNNKAIEAMVNQFNQDGFDITWSTKRKLPESQLIYAFGSDQTLKEIHQNNPNSLVRGYGHRFSVAICGDSQEEARMVAKDFSSYDGRGCMAPVAVFCAGDTTKFLGFLAGAMAEMQQSLPCGVIDPYLGPEIRRRIGLAHAKGTLSQGEKWKILLLPKALFIPVSLPRIVTVHGISTADEALAILSPWKGFLSSLSTNLNTQTATVFPRVCPLGSMQQPPFPRFHDGKPMWITQEDLNH